MAGAFKSGLNNISFTIVNSIEQFYYRLGIKIAQNPYKTILFSWMCVFVCILGLFRFHYEKNPLNLWVPPQSHFYHDTQWLMKKFKQGVRSEYMIITAPNVLTPGVFQKVAEIDNLIKNSETPLGINLNDVCVRVPVDNIIKDQTKRNVKNVIKNRLEIDSLSKLHGFDPSIDLHSGLYCAVVQALKMGCLQINAIDLWDFKMENLNNLTEEEILNKINTAKTSSVLQYPYKDLLGNVKRNSSGHIISADSLMSIWMINVDFSSIDMDKSGNQAGTADWASESVLSWEQHFLNIMGNISTSTNLSVYYEAGRSFGDISEASMFQDIDKLIIGITLMVIYVQMVISKFNCIEFRMFLGGFGILCVGMAFISGCGICSLLGISYGPVHTSLPFLLMGLGVDDMFVLVASWKQLSNNKALLSLPERIGLMLQHAGVSITVTSVTDVTAFLVGATTILPSLQSFCLFAALGVFMTFIFAVTFFTACFVLDQIRIEQFRNSFVPWYQHEQPYTFNKCNKGEHTNIFIKYIYSKIILTNPGKICIISLTAFFSILSIIYIFKLEQKFDPNWFIPEDTYLHQYIETRNIYYPLMGHEAGIYFGALNYSHEFKNIHNLALKLQNETSILNNVQTWTTPFINYLNHINENLDPFILSDAEWRYYISKFLYSPNGAHFQANFRFDKELICGEDAPNITVSNIDFRFNVFEGPENTLPAMKSLRNMILNVNLTTEEKFCTVWAKIFGNWVTDEVIDTEIIRNMLLALVCVMMCTIILITNFQICFWILLCVLLTIVNVCGCMQRLGLTIDLVACIALQLSVGLCVDYATHIGHTFLTIKNGSRLERTIEAVTHIGAAVFYGGASTLLALSMLSLSESYVFKSFFKIFFLVICFGLFHGVLLLPVILSLIGPQPYSYTRSNKKIVDNAEQESLNKQNCPSLSNDIEMS